MSLSERLNLCPVCDRPKDEPSVGVCTHRSHGPDGTGREPEWRRRMRARLAEKGRVAEKALDR